jgi:hypothetical protein
MGILKDKSFKVGMLIIVAMVLKSAVFFMVGSIVILCIWNYALVPSISSMSKLNIGYAMLLQLGYTLLINGIFWRISYLKKYDNKETS